MQRFTFKKHFANEPSQTISNDDVKRKENKMDYIFS